MSLFCAHIYGKHEFPIKNDYLGGRGGLIDGQVNGGIHGVHTGGIHGTQIGQHIRN